jgi:hypothetical protein
MARNTRDLATAVQRLALKIALSFGMVLWMFLAATLAHS